MEHILNLEQVKKYYGGNSGNITKAVDGISMYVDKGEFVAIMEMCIRDSFWCITPFSLGDKRLF